MPADAVTCLHRAANFAFCSQLDSSMGIGGDNVTLPVFLLHPCSHCAHCYGHLLAPCSKHCLLHFRCIFMDNVTLSVSLIQPCRKYRLLQFRFLSIGYRGDHVTLPVFLLHLCSHCARGCGHLLAPCSKHRLLSSWFITQSVRGSNVQVPIS